MRAANTAPGSYADHVIVLGAGAFTFATPDPSAPTGDTAQPLEPLHVPPQGGEFSERGLGPAASIKQRVDLLHDRTQLLQLGQPPGETPEGLAFRFAQVTLDAQIRMGE
jgi:hypothetical protein